MTDPTPEQVAEATRKFGLMLNVSEEAHKERGITGAEIAVGILALQRDVAQLQDRCRTVEIRVRALEGER